MSFTPVCEQADKGGSISLEKLANTLKVLNMLLSTCQLTLVATASDMQA